MEPPPPGRSPERSAWSAAETPRLKVWLRLMRVAHAGGLEASPELVAGLSADVE